jgi:hypothetical protein
MDRETRKAALAALVILFGFGAFAYFLPTLMLAAGSVSQVLAVVVGVVFLLVLFVVFWLRGRAQRKG